MIITFDKGQFILTNDEAKTIRISLDGTMTSYTGRTVKHMPNGFRKCDISNAVRNLHGVESVLWSLCHGADHGIAEKVERLWNANTLHQCITVVDSCRGQFYLGNAYEMFHELTFKQLLNAVREYEEEVAESYFLSNLADWYYMRDFLNAASTQELMNYYQQDDLLHVYSWYQDEWAKVEKMLRDDSVYDIYCTFGFDDALRVIKGVLRLAKELDVKCPTKNLLHAYANLTREAENVRNRRKNETLAAHQNPAWAYEGNGFVVIVPTTMQELVAEGQAQHNCVGDYWTRAYGNDLGKGEQKRGVVFIRRANRPQKSYITCDFDLETMCICQFLGTYNDTVEDADAKAFRKEYQRHLLTC